MERAPKGLPALKPLRKAKKLTLDALAQKSGVAASSLSRYENSLRDPGFWEVCDIASALGVSLKRFTTGAEQESRRAS